MMKTASTENQLTGLYSKITLLVISAISLSSIISPPIALLLGIIFAQFIKHPFLETTKKATNWLLKISVIGLGFGMTTTSAIQAGKEGFIFTLFTIFGTLILGFILGKIFRIDKTISFLISGGTAICGGSAIATLSQIVKAKPDQISIALGVIFILNSVSLFIFPTLGHLMQMSQSDFGLWCAIAIHDTSSVVGASAKYGNEALGTATTVKLARALWIIPIALSSSFLFKQKDLKIKIPYFIGLFILAIIANTYVPVAHNLSPIIVKLAKAGLTLTLFLIGTSLSYKLIKSVGISPILQGTILWISISVFSLIAILLF
ncbi:MAG TPA: putative sulfate exporter family transporter [Saprospiraceae bacterium]|nr:putative sulfate exporter family transporter [Saprospiraceae bacterium]